MRITIDIDAPFTEREASDLCLAVAGDALWARPEARIQIDADTRVPFRPFDIPAHDMATGRDVDDTNGEPVAPIDPYAAIKERVQASIKRLVEAIGNSDPFPMGRQLDTKCGEPDCVFCLPLPIGGEVPPLFTGVLPFPRRLGKAFDPNLNDYSGLGLAVAASTKPTESIGAPGTVDANGNIVSRTPGMAYSAGSVYIGVDELERAELAGWRPWLGVVGSKVVGVRR